MTVYTVYDALGRAVATLRDGDLAAGQHEVQWAAEGRASGRYLVRIAGPSGTLTVPVTLVR